MEDYNDNLKLLGVDRRLKMILFVRYISYSDHVKPTKTIPMVSYCLETKQWINENHTSLEFNIGQLYGCSASVVVSKTIYWSSDWQVKAYDFEMKI